MAEVVVPQPPLPRIYPTRDSNNSNCLSFEMETADSRSANSTFVFPPPSSLSPPPSQQLRTPSKAPISSHRRKPSNLSISALPPVDFGLGLHESSLRPLPSPTRSPSRLTPPGHVALHRRGGSEFVGGDITHGGPVLVATNITHEDNAPPIPSSPPKGPPAARARHVHRRSGAVSQSDIKMIMQPSADSRADSAPQTPSLPHLPQRPMGPERSSSFPGPRSSLEDRSGLSRRSLRAEGEEPRSRVDFTDQVEFIPRPLSIISSETSSSVSTVRARHSVSESVGSSSYAGTSSPPSFKASSPSDKDCCIGRFPTPEEAIDCSVRDTQLHSRASPKLRLESEAPMMYELPEKAERQENGTGVSKLYQPIDQFQEVPSHDAKANNDCTRDTMSNAFGGRSQPRSLSGSDHPRPRTSPESKTSKDQHRSRSWATILHRKDRQTLKDTRPTDCSSLSTTDDTLVEPDFSLDYINFDDDTTFIIEEQDANPRLPVKLQTNVPHQGSHMPNQQSEYASPSPMIDLDAALNSVSTPKNDPGFDDYFNRSSSVKRRLHSSGETGGFVGSGMHYHRRADSAPEMDILERPRLGFPRLGSNPTMEEAIVEEEEDVDQDPERREEHILGLGVNVVDSDGNSESHIRRKASNWSGTGLDTGPRPRSTLDDFGTAASVEIVEAEEEPRFSVVTKSSDDSTITPTLSPEPFSCRPASAPLESAFQTPSLSYGTTPETPSAVSSADYRKTLFDVSEPDIRTASSSITGVTLDSSKGGNAGASSVDDVPSLTGSASTMLSGPSNRYSSSGHTVASADRPASFSAAVPARTRPHSSSKRASLASLSKLVGGSYNRSKLNIAETLPPDTPEKAAKKRHRISRMMKFWKSKEKLSPG